MALRQRIYSEQEDTETTSPPLTLQGRWLEDLGFNTGQPVTVTVERGRLVIEAEIRI
ncbi:type I toxin-antitoxin system SymE family toxin [Dickeya undicola]|uniref:Type I toxin-antitoxin system SymE family toxin n=1 Tax=Dickeya undicola TaxID=1577887 RepID=A0ABX9X0K7_9GAMM|nr:SymE family type I addiction module toxin [Dickeya undicola]RNM25841.1 type I toxin-antitoxin system SymE family toxin [Dickeya undicola]